jgi:hypothetical protein
MLHGTRNIVGATPSESRIREIRTCGSMMGRRSKYLLLLYWLGLERRMEREKPFQKRFNAISTIRIYGSRGEFEHR